MLKIIIGRSGSGKSQKCIEEFNAYIQKNIGVGSYAYLFVPEQYSMLTERRLLEFQKNEAFPIRGLIGHEVVNFKRFAHRILSIYGFDGVKQLNESGKFMLLTAAIENIKDELVYYKGINKKNGEISTLLKLIDEFKKYGVSYQDLMNSDIDDEYLYKKISEISKIYCEYERLKEGKYSDNNDAFKKMLYHVKKENFFYRKKLWIDSFTGFTKEELELITIMLNQCDTLTITLCTDLSHEPSFASIDKTYNILLELAENNGIDVVVENLSLNKDFELSKYNNASLFYLEQNISKLFTKKQYEDNEIYLTECEDVYSEIERCAQRIKALNNSGMEFKHISVALRNLQGYDTIIKAVFRKYNIPFYIDDKKSIDNNPLIKTITSILNIIAYDWRVEDVLECIKSNVLSIINSPDFMEEIIFTTGLKGKSRWKKSQSDICKEFYDSITKLDKALNKCENLKEASKTLCKYLEMWEASKIIKHLSDNNDIISQELKNEYSRIWNIFIEVIQQIVDFLGDLKCDGAKDASEKLGKLLCAGFSNYKIGFLPSNIDSVQIIDIDRSRSTEIKALFVLGLNDGVLPARFTDDGILKDKDRSLLEKSNIYLADDIESKAAKENYFIYIIMSLATDILDISWPTQDVSGGQVRRNSIILRKIRNIFPDIKIENYKNNFGSESIDNASKNETDAFVEYNINSELFKLDGELTTNVSQLETYNKCPFSYFLTYGLKLKDRDDAELQNVDFGNFLHNMVDSASGTLFEMSETQLEDYKLFAEKIFSTVTDTFRIDMDFLTERDKHLINRLKSYTGWIFKNIKNQMDVSGFKIYGTEVTFDYSDDSKLKPVVLDVDDNLENLKRINIVGKIDRIDLFEQGDSKFVRIIDYKSSSSSGSISDNDIKAGIKLQLITYLYATIGSFGKNNTKPAGVFYYVFNNDISTADSHISSIEDKKNVEKKGTLKGFAIQDDDIIYQMTGGNTFVMGGRSKKDGSFSLSGKNVKSYEEFENMKNEVYMHIKNASQGIAKGEFPVKPNKAIKDLPCQYCKMRSVCAICNRIDNSK